MPKYNLFYNLLIYSINASLAQCGGMGKKWGICGKEWGIIPHSSFLLDIV